jgi:nicotinamide phosphoribosyltransferase
MSNNILLRTDVYKLNHMVMYKPGTEYVYSYLTTRSEKNFNEVVFFGLQYYLRRYLVRPVTWTMVEEFIQVHDDVIGKPPAPEVIEQLRALVRLGYWPIHIKAVPEGTVLPIQNVLMTIENTKPGFHWCVGFIESLLLKLWYSCTVATQCHTYRKVVQNAFAETSDLAGSPLEQFMVHDFGYRGDGSEEGAEISGAAHLLSFTGSDTIPAFNFARQYYMADRKGLMASVPASEHSVMCSYGRDNEIEAFERMLELYPTGIVSIVSDTYNIWDVLTRFAEELKPQILARDGKVVFRPDSGNPPDIICGTALNPKSPHDSPEGKGCLRLLDEMFGHTVNSKGFKVLNQKVGLIYGDGMYLQRYKDTLARMKEMGYSAENLVIGVGGILRNHTRDTLGFAIKATHIVVNGKPRSIMKDPVTDHKKKSHKGLLRLERQDGKFVTFDDVSREQEGGPYLLTKFIDGSMPRYDTFNQIRARIADARNCQV